MVVRVCHPSSWEVETGESKFKFILSSNSLVQGFSSLGFFLRSLSPSGKYLAALRVSWVTENCLPPFQPICLANPCRILSYSTWDISACWWKTLNTTNSLGGWPSLSSSGLSSYICLPPIPVNIHFHTSNLVSRIFVRVSPTILNP